MHATRYGFPIVSILALTLLLTSALAPQAAQAVPTGVVSGLDVARVPGVEEAVGRSFDSYETAQSSGIGHLEFAVLAFPDAEAAHTAMPEVFPALNAVLRREAESLQPPDIGDESLAWNASGPENLGVTILIVRSDARIHLSVAVAESGEPLDALERIAVRMIDREPGATPAAAPASPEARPLTTGGLWDLLPRYDDLPGEFGLYTEESWPVPEPPGVPPAPTPADCTVEPRPRPDLEADTSGIASPQPIATPGTAATPAIGEPADAETVEAVTGTIHEYLACIALGDWPRAYGLVSDRYFYEQVSQLDQELIDFLYAGDAMPPVAAGPRLVAVDNVQILPDGSVRATAETISLFDVEQQREVAHVWLVREGNRYVIDTIQPIE